ncbi:MAG: SAF domain-containing protein [Candidatus Limnocylindrales bacterium]
MEMEYKDPGRRGKWIILLGVILAVGAAAAAFYLINNAQQQAGRGTAKTTTAVVAAKPLPAKKTLTADDLIVRDDVPLDSTTSIPGMVATTKDQLVGRILGVDVAAGQLMTLNLLASTSVGGQFPILGPGETVAPDSDAWRAISITVSDDHAVGGMLAAGMTVDVVLTEVMKAPPSAEPATQPGQSGSPSPTPRPSASAVIYEAGLSTKVTYQKMQILARTGTSYVLKATLPVAEEITQAELDGGIFTLLLRPDQDTRILDVSGLGTTTSRILQRYGLLFPEAWPGNGHIPSNPPIPAITPAPSPSDSGSAAPSGSPAASPSGG